MRDTNVPIDTYPLLVRLKTAVGSGFEHMAAYLPRARRCSAAEP